MSRDSALARALRATVERDDWFAVEALLADAATLHVPGRSGLSGPYRGRDAIHALLDKLGALGEGMFGFEPERVAVDRNLTIVLGRFVCRSGTAVQHTPAVLACETSRGQVVDVRVFPTVTPASTFSIDERTQSCRHEACIRWRPPRS